MFSSTESTQLEKCRILPQLCLPVFRDDSSSSFMWPMSRGRQFSSAEHITQILIKFLNDNLDEEIGELCLLGSGPIFSKSRHWSELAYLIQSEREGRCKISRNTPDLEKFYTVIQNMDHNLNLGTQVSVQRFQKPSFLFARRAMRKMTMSNVCDIPKQMFTDSNTCVISHNELLVSEARKQKFNHDFVHAELLVQRLRETVEVQVGAQIREKIDETAKNLAGMICSGVAVDTDIKNALFAFIHGITRSCLNSVISDWRKAQKACFIPDRSLWLREQLPGSVTLYGRAKAEKARDLLFTWVFFCDGRPG